MGKQADWHKKLSKRNPLKKEAARLQTALDVANHRLENFQADVRDKEKKIAALMVELQARNAVLEGAKQALGNAKRELSKLQDLGIEAWACPNSPENPVCISTPGDSTEGHSLNLYVRGGVIVGVTVHERETGKLVTAAGLVAHDPNG